MEGYSKDNFLDCSMVELIADRLSNCNWNIADCPDCRRCCDTIHSFDRSERGEAQRQVLCRNERNQLKTWDRIKE
jgi:hypothetical protein